MKIGHQYLKHLSITQTVSNIDVTIANLETKSRSVNTDNLSATMTSSKIKFKKYLFIDLGCGVGTHRGVPSTIKSLKNSKRGNLRTRNLDVIPFEMVKMKSLEIYDDMLF